MTTTGTNATADAAETRQQFLREISFVRSRTVIGNEAAEEGRKRSTYFPPLAKEHSFPEKKLPSSLFNRDNAHIYQGPLEELNDSHWHVSTKRVSPILDRRIVNHLRKRLYRRIERRIHRQFAHSQEADDRNPWNQSKKKRTKNERLGDRESDDIYSKYNEFGEKLLQSKAHSTQTSRNSSRGHRRSNSNSPSKDSIGISPELTNGAALIHQFENQKTTKLPSIKSDTQDNDSSNTEKSTDINVQSSDYVDKEVEVHVTGDVTTLEDVLTDESDQKESDVSDGELSKLLGQDEESPDTNFRSNVVSPVPTPSVYRPGTREHARGDIRDTLDRVIKGQVNVGIVQRTKLYKVFISADFIDTEAERTFMVEKVFPRLKATYRFRGLELHILDPHWGLRDAMTDDHSLPETILRILADCQATSEGINFISFLSHKYGTALLPNIIPCDEFEAILYAAEAERSHQLELVAARKAAEAAARHHVTINEDEHDEGIEDITIDSDGKETIKESLGKSDPESGRAESVSDSFMVTPSLPDIHVGPGSKPVSPTKRLTMIDPDASMLDLQRRLSVMGRHGTLEADLSACDTGLLKTWYKLDENAIPAHYKLQPISSHFPNITKTDTNKRQQAKNNWITTAKRIQKTLQRFARELFNDRRIARKYFASLQDLELEMGLLETDSPHDHCLWFRRNISDIHYQVQDPDAKIYVDLDPHQPIIDTTAAEALHSLQHEIPAKLPDQHMREYVVQWSKGGIDLNLRSHQLYVDSMSHDMSEIILKSIEDTFEGDTWTGAKYELYEEISEHVKFCQERAKVVHGQKELLHTIKSYLRSECKLPIILHGASGTGKTSIAAKATKELTKWLKGHDVSVLIRFIGRTSQSRSVRLLLRSLCLQLCEIFENDANEIPKDYKGLLNDFAHRLCQASPNQPIVVILDGLDRLTDSNEARKLLWLPKSLPPNVHMVLTTLPDEKFECLKSLKGFYGKFPDCFMEMGDMPTADACLILEHWFHGANRSLTLPQRRVLMACFEECRIPLFLRMCFTETVLWPSYLPDGLTKLTNTIRKLVTLTFGRLEKNHGEPIARRFLGHITASRHGLTQSELEDVLSLDEIAMDEVMHRYNTPHRRFPTILLLRLIQDLGEYLTETQADGAVTLTWLHSQFSEAGSERYLTLRDRASYHKVMAEYFLGKWARGNLKPYGTNEKGVDRYVLSQDLYEVTSTGKRIYNQRKLRELPFHLLNSQQMDVLKSECLCNFEWLLASLCGTSIREILEEFNAGLSVEPGDADLKLVADTLHLSCEALMRDARQLGSQIIGRLHSIIAADKPAAPQDPLKYPFVLPLLNQVHKSSQETLVPSGSCLTPPLGILFDTLSGHTEPITAVTVTTDGLRAITTASDNKMKVWDLRSGRVTKSISGVGQNVLSICLGLGNNIAITSEKKCIRAWSLRSGECLMTVSDIHDQAIIATAGQGELLVALLDGSDTMRTWNLSKMKELPQVHLQDSGVHKERSLLLAGNAHLDTIMYAFRSAFCGVVVNARKGKKKCNIICPEKSACIQALAITGEYYVVACRYQYMKFQEIIRLELFDIRNGSHLRNVRGCIHDNVRELYTNQLGSHAMCVCSLEGGNSSNVAIWNLETEDHKHMAQHGGQSVMGACSDFRFCLTANKTDTALRVWNLSTSINKPSPKPKTIEGIEALMPMRDNPRYVVAKSMNSGPIAVWNVGKANCKAVHVERGLGGESQDVHLIRNMQVIILTDKKFSSFGGDETQQNFTRVQTYNLRTKRFEKSISGVFIVPLPAHEYRLLSSNRLLGLSDNRGYFIIWSLDTGQVVQKIKPHYKDRLDLDVSFSKTFKVVQKRGTTAKMTPWERRAETEEERTKRRQREEREEIQRIKDLDKEKDNPINQYILSGNEKVIVASFYAHHLCVFDVDTQTHTYILENEHSMLFLYTAALTFDGSYLVMANYDDHSKVSYVTLWDNNTGLVKKRLKNEKGVCTIAMTDNGDRVVFGKENKEMRIWDPFCSKSISKIKGYPSLQFEVDSKIFLIEKGSKAVVFARDISVWDLDSGRILALFTPDKGITCCNIAMDGGLIVFGLRDSQEVITLRLTSKNSMNTIEEVKGEDLFGEVSSSDNEVEDDDDQ